MLLRKIFTYLCVATVLFALWKVAGGDLGVMITNARQFAWGILNWTSDVAIRYWPQIRAAFGQ